MIRRDIRLSDGFAGWALISQVEHARISAQLAELCIGRFTEPGLEAVRGEVLEGILSHDDGWTEWEQSPRLHGDSRPVSFMELEPAEAVAVWSRSIERSAAHGPLAAWIVAGHFCRLLDIHSPPGKRDADTAQWYDALQQRRHAWLAQWLAKGTTTHTDETAHEALQWLWTFDEASLWFCCRCPSQGEASPAGDQRLIVGKGTPLEMQLSSGAAESSTTRDVGGAAAAQPWRFAQDAVIIEAAVRLVPATRYDDAAAVLAASRPHTLRWHLTRQGSRVT